MQIIKLKSTLGHSQYSSNFHSMKIFDYAAKSTITIIKLIRDYSEGTKELTLKCSLTTTIVILINNYIRSLGHLKDY